MRKIFATLLILTISTALIAADKKDGKEDPWSFKSKSARSALKSYSTAITGLNRKGEAALTKMQKGYDKEVKAKRLELVMAMEKALDTETEKKNLKEAIKIQEAVEAIKDGASPPDAPELLVMGGEKTTVKKKSPLKDGVYRADFGNYPWVFEYHVKGNKIRCPKVHNDDGHSEKRNWRGQISKSDNDTVAFRWDDGHQSVWTIAGPKIFVEHWSPDHDKSKPANFLAIIRRDK